VTQDPEVLLFLLTFGSLFVVILSIAAVEFTLLYTALALKSYQKYEDINSCGFLLFKSIAFMLVAYRSIFASHTITPNELNTIIGFVDDDGLADSTARSPLSPPRVTYSTFSITMSYLKINMYLSVLAVVIGLGNVLVKHVVFDLAAYYPYLANALYCGGFFFYTCRVFNYRTNILFAVAIAFIIYSMANDKDDFSYCGIVVVACSYCFLCYGGESAAEETAEHSAAAPVAFTTVTGTESYLEAQDMSKGRRNQR
jgi:hypothetical protein